MTKTHSLAGLAVTAMLLAGCQSTTQPISEASPSPGIETDDSASVGRNLTEVAAEIMGGATYVCSFENPDEAQEMSYTMQGKKISMTVIDKQQGSTTSRIVSDGTMTYIWTPDTKQGMKFKTMTPEEMQKLNDQAGQNQAPETPDLSKPEALEQFQEQYQVKCRPLMTANSEFEVPTDVTFQDMSQLLESMNKKQVPQ